MSARPAACIVLILACASAAFAQEPIIDRALAEQYFGEARALWRQDGGKLWGVSLESPLIFADRRTRQVVASHADNEGRLKADGNLFAGRLTDNVNVANYSLTWAGVKWTMVVWPLPKDKAERAALMMHESWHRVQAEVGLPPTGPANVHLDALEGRYWLQLEWRALAEALQGQGDKRKQAVVNALIFRARRRGLFKNAAEEERLLEMHEGLAEYTGVRLAGLSEAERLAYVVKKLEQRPAEMPTFVRSFAYLSGPAYGLLLDAANPDWRKKLKKEDDLGMLLRNAMDLLFPDLNEAQLTNRVNKYQGERLRASEEKRDGEVRKRIAAFRERLVDGPRLIIPLQKMQMSFDPNAVQPIEGVGTAYPTLRLVDAWGTLTVTSGALIAADFTKAYVAAPKDPKARPIKEPDWELRLNDGWKVEPGERQGDFKLVKEAK
jgi:hypothetical protein